MASPSRLMSAPPAVLPKRPAAPGTPAPAVPTRHNVTGGAVATRTGARPTPLELQGPWLRLGQVSWLAVAIVGWAMFVLSLPPRYAQLAATPVGGEQALAQLNLSPDFYAAYNVSLEIILALICSSVAAVIFWRKAHERIALYVSFMLLLCGMASRPVLSTMDALLVAQPGWTPVVYLLTYLTWFSVFIFFYVFPDGRFALRWTQLLPVGVALILIPWDLFPDSPLSPWKWPPLAFIALELALWGSGIAVQIYRYRHHSSRIQRQQTRWVVFGVTAAVVIGLAFYFPRAFDLLPGGNVERLVYDLVSVTGITLAALITPITIGISILRYRLWGIDMIISRALVYVPLTAILAGVYSAIIALLQKSFIALTGDESDAAVVITTLLLVTVFTPVKNSLQSFVDKRFKGATDPDHALKAFRAEVQADMGVIDPRRMARRLLDEVVDAYEAVSGAVYLGPPEQLQLVEAAGEWKGPPALSLPLVSNGAHLGLLTLGTRPHGREYSARDRDTLQAVVDLIAGAIAPADNPPARS